MRFGFCFRVEAFGDCGARGVIAGRLLCGCGLSGLVELVNYSVMRFDVGVAGEMVGRAAELIVALSACAGLAGSVANVNLGVCGGREVFVRSGWCWRFCCGESGGFDDGLRLRGLVERPRGGGRRCFDRRRV